jgi:hypothetical protein
MTVDAMGERRPGEYERRGTVLRVRRGLKGPVPEGTHLFLSA